jgi:hypothetical protein
LRVDQVPYGLGEIGGFDGILFVVAPPHLIQFGDALTPRIIGLQDLDAFHRIGTPERQ